MRIMLLINFIICNFYYMNFAFAKCNAVAGLLTISGRDIVVKNETPISTLLDTFSLGSFQTYRCDDNNTANMRTGGRAYGDFATYIDGIRVYKTNIEGIGYSFGVQSMCGDLLFPTQGWRGDLDNIATCWNEDIWNQITHNFEARIYKIGPTASGTVAKKQIGATILSYNNHNNWAEENPVFLNAFKVTTIGSNNGKQGNNNSGDQSSNNGGQGSNNHGEQGNNNRDGQDNRNRGSQGNNQNNNAVWPNNNINNNSIWPNDNVNNNLDRNVHY